MFRVNQAPYLVQERRVQLGPQILAFLQSLQWNAVPSEQNRDPVTVSFLLCNPNNLNWLAFKEYPAERNFLFINDRIPMFSGSQDSHFGGLARWQYEAGFTLRRVT